MVCWVRHFTAVGRDADGKLTERSFTRRSRECRCCGRQFQTYEETEPFERQLGASKRDGDED